MFLCTKKRKYFTSNLVFGSIIYSIPFPKRCVFGRSDPQPQDQLITWMEDAHKKFEKVIATQKQEDIDEELRRSAEWASVIQRSQTM